MWLTDIRRIFTFSTIFLARMWISISWNMWNYFFKAFYKLPYKGNLQPFTKVKGQSNPTPDRHGKVIFLANKKPFLGHDVKRRRVWERRRPKDWVCVKFRGQLIGVCGVCVSCLSVSRLSHRLFSQMWGFIKPFTQANNSATMRVCVCVCHVCVCVCVCVCACLVQFDCGLCLMLHVWALTCLWFIGMGASSR